MAPTIIMLFLFGTIIGSFLNVVIYRHNTGKGLGGHSHCTSCGTRLSSYELIPLLSYLAQYGRCRSCSARITPQYFLVELTTGAAFALSLLVATDLVSLVLTLAVFSVLIVIVVYDLHHLIIPDVFVVALVVLALAYLSWNPLLGTLHLPPPSALLGGLGAALFFASFWFFSKGRWMGLGDAKLAFPLGCIVGYPAVLSFVVFSFWIGAVVTLLLLGLQHLFKRGQKWLRFPYTTLRMKSEVPFAPFLVAAFFAVYLFSADVFEVSELILSFL